MAWSTGFITYLIVGCIFDQILPFWLLDVWCVVKSVPLHAMLFINLTIVIMYKNLEKLFTSWKTKPLYVLKTVKTLEKIMFVYPIAFCQPAKIAYWSSVTGRRIEKSSKDFPANENGHDVPRLFLDYEQPIQCEQYTKFYVQIQKARLR